MLTLKVGGNDGREHRKVLMKASNVLFLDLSVRHLCVKFMKIHQSVDIQHILFYMNIVLQHNIKIAVKSKVISKGKKMLYAYAIFQQKKKPKS